jgi:Ser/Thr protein kinase RdoA (MazF antagonist)
VARPSATPAQQEAVLSIAKPLYGTDQFTPASGGTTNFVYHFEQDGKGRILRWIPVTDDRVRSEIEWIQYLGDQGAPVVHITPSQNNQLIEVIEVEGLVAHSVAFEKIDGLFANDLPHTPELIRKAGSALGLIHRMTKQYQPTFRRPDWQPRFALVASSIPAEQILIHAKWQQLLDYLKTLPQAEASYGLVHGDYQWINLFDVNGEIVVIDFDDSHYNWWIYDVANMLFFGLWDTDREGSNTDFAADLLANFMAGYETENHLDPFWLQQIPFFLKLNEFYVYASTYQIFGLDKGAEMSSIPLKFQKALARYRFNLENDVPYIESAHFPWREY